MKHLVLISIFLLCFSTAIFSQWEEALKDKYLIVLDIQDCFLDQKFPEQVKTDLINKTNEVIKQANPDQVIYIQSIIRVLSIDKHGIRVDTASYLDFSKDLLMVNDRVFLKSKPNTFTSAEFVSFLESHKVSDIAIVGLLAEHCVSATALGGLKEGYEMYILPQAIIGKTESDKIKAFKKLKKKGVKELAINL